LDFRPRRAAVVEVHLFELVHGQYDTWKVNTDAEYHEDGTANDLQLPGVGRALPHRVRSA